MSEVRLIDANELCKYVWSISNSYLNEWDTAGVLMAIERQKTIDAVPVVRCKDCEMAVESGSNYLICTGWGCPTDFDGFCHMGERRYESCGATKK